MKKSKLIILTLFILVLFIPTVLAQEANSTACGTVNSDLTLTADVVSLKDCFTVNASDITIDGNGFTITNGGSSSRRAVVIYNSTNVTNVIVKNFASIDGFGTGIDLEYAPDANITNNTITTTGTSDRGISAYGSPNIIISYNTISSSGIASKAINIVESGPSQIINNDLTVSATSADAIELSNNTDTLISFNVIDAAGGSSIGSAISLREFSTNVTINENNLSCARACVQLKESSDVIIISNDIDKSSSGSSMDISLYSDRVNITHNNINVSSGSGTGINLNSVSQASVTTNIITGSAISGESGVSLDNVTSATIENNTITVKYVVIDLDDSYGNAIISNNITSTLDKAINVRSSEFNTFTLNRIASFGTSTDAIVLLNSNYTYLTSNGVTSVSGDGISIEDSSHLRSVHGLYIAPSANDVYGNGTNITFVNLTVPKTRLYSGGIMHFKWFVDVYVNQTNGSIVSGAIVEAYDSDSNLEFNTTTGTNGYISTEEVTEFFVNASGLNYLTPSSINVSASGFAKENDTGNLTALKNTLIVITLSNDTDVPNITSFTLSPTSVITGGTITPTCTADDDDPNLNVTVTGVDTSTTGTFNATCTATDFNGNMDQEVTTYTVTASSSGSSSGGGSSGGGSGGGGGGFSLSSDDEEASNVTTGGTTASVEAEEETDTEDPLDQFGESEEDSGLDAITGAFIGPISPKIWIPTAIALVLITGGLYVVSRRRKITPSE